VPGGGREGTRRQRRHARGATLKRLGAKGTRGAHREHAQHGVDAGGVEAQRLVEGRRGLPSRRERGHMRCGEGEVRAGRRGRAWGVVAAHKRHARGWPDPRLGGMRGAHVEHVAYVRDAGGVEAQRLVEGRRALPSRREGMQCGEGEVRAGRREGLRCVVAARQEACTGKRPDSRLNWGPRARAERTRNMPPMDLTLEVSKLSSWLKADEDCRVEGRAHAMRGRRGASREAGGPGVWWRHTSGMHGDGPTQGLGACAERT